jgi:hypothetical protein
MSADEHKPVEHNPDDEFAETLRRRMQDAVEPIEGGGFRIDEIHATARARHHRRAVGAAVAAAVAAISVGVAVFATREDDHEQVRAGVSTTAAAQEPCLQPGAEGSIGYVRLTNDQRVALLQASIETDSPDLLSAVMGEDAPVLLSGGQYEALRAAGEPIDTRQLRQMGYDLGTGGPATTAPTTTGAPPPTTTLPEGTTPFDAWVAALRDRGLLTPDQEAEIAAGRGISLTPEQSRVMDELFGAPPQTMNGPVADPGSPGGVAGPALCH